MTIAFGVGCLIAHQVSACPIATAYATECFLEVLERWCNSGDVQFVDQLCFRVLGAAFHQRFGVWMDVHALRSGCVCLDGGCYSNDYVRKEMEDQMCAKTPKHYRFIGESRLE